MTKNNIGNGRQSSAQHQSHETNCVLIRGDVAMERITKYALKRLRLNTHNVWHINLSLPSSAVLSVWSCDGKDTGDEAGSCGSSVCQTSPSSGMPGGNSDALPDPLASSLSRKAAFTLEEIHHHPITTFQTDPHIREPFIFPWLAD